MVGPDDRSSRPGVGHDHRRGGAAGWERAGDSQIQLIVGRRVHGGVEPHEGCAHRPPEHHHGRRPDEIAPQQRLVYVTGHRERRYGRQLSAVLVDTDTLAPNHRARTILVELANANLDRVAPQSIVSVQKHQVVAARVSETCVPRGRQSSVRLPDAPNARKPPDNGGRVVRRPVVHDDNFVCRPCLGQNALERFVEEMPLIENGNRREAHQVAKG